MSKQESLQLAEIRLVRIRQERLEKYQHYDQLRRTATGILQALDLGMIRAEIFRKVTEELMINIPKFWLAPAAVALVSWVNDQKELAQKALNEALRRDEKKTALFFALISRRYDRVQASRQWFEYYFQVLNPAALEPEFGTLLDGMTSGVFSVNVRQIFQKKINRWLKEFSIDYQLIDNQRCKWKKALSERGSMNITIKKYSYVKEMCSNWQEIQYATERHMYFERIAEVVEDWLEEKDNRSEKIVVKVDNLLDQLVYQPVEKERELRNEERKLEAIIACNGDWDLGLKKFEKEGKGNQKTIHLLDLLRKNALNLDQNTAPATQKYCLALCKDWIREAHEDLTTEIRSLVPSGVELIRPGTSLKWETLDNWKFTVVDGSEEIEAVRSIHKCVDKSAREEIRKEIRKKIKKYFDRNRQRFFEKSYILKVLLLLFAAGLVDSLFFGDIGIVFWVPLLFFWYFQKWKCGRPFRQLKTNYKKYATRMLKASIADIVDWRRDLKKMDHHSDDLPNLLKEINAEEMLSREYDKAREVIS